MLSINKTSDLGVIAAVKKDNFVFEKHIVIT